MSDEAIKPPSSNVSRPKWGVFRLGAWLATIALVFATLGMIDDVSDFVATPKSTPNGPLVVDAIWAPEATGFSPGDSADFGAGERELEQGFTEASKGLTASLSTQMPEGWVARGPYEPQRPETDGKNVGNGVLPAPEVKVAVPDADVPDRWRLWLPHLLESALLVVCLSFARSLLFAITNKGPFDPIVFRYLWVIAVSAIVGTFLIETLNTEWLNGFYSQLDLARFGLMDRREGANVDEALFNPVWLFALAVVEILRYGAKLQEEADVTA